MTNKEWDKYHKENKIKPVVDIDFEKFLKRFYMSDKEPRTILDLGCGQGGNLAYMSYNYKDWVCYGSDFSQKALCIVNGKMIKRDNVLLKQCNAEGTIYNDNKFDLIVCTFLMSNNDYKKIIKECHRILTPGGRIFIKELLVCENNIDNKYIERHELRYKESQFNEVLNDSGFGKIQIAKSLNKDISVEYLVCTGRKK